jgi:putative DNA primase/helicase
MLMKGPGGNGKSFLLDIVQTILGDASTAASMAELSKGVGDHFSATLVGKLLLVDDDFKAKGLLPDDWMKKLTGQKALTANPKFQQQFNFLCRTMVVILSNGWPSTQDVSDGMRRRANVFEVNNVLSDDERDPAHRTAIIERELPGVLNRLIAGWSRVLKGGGKLRPPVEIVNARERWLEHGSSALRFARECLEPTFDDTDRLLFKDVWAAYKQWMAVYEDSGKRLGRHGLLEQLLANGLRVAGFDGHTRSEYFLGWRIPPGVEQSLVEAGGL